MLPEVDFSFLNRHSAAVLQFSGGKDSTACLYLLEPYWDKIVVAWVNTGQIFPETRAIMDRIKEEVPHFVEVVSVVSKYHEQEGWPTEILPISATPMGRILDGGEVKLVPYTDCCRVNIWEPMGYACVDASLIIRGTKKADVRKSFVQDGVYNGQEYWHPIWEWSNEQIKDYLNDRNLLPSHYDHTETSLDCRTCTAYTYENHRKMLWLREVHPEAHKEILRRFRIIREEIDKSLVHIDQDLDK